jgi:hypothetical protein
LQSIYASVFVYSTHQPLSMFSSQGHWPIFVSISAYLHIHKCILFRCVLRLECCKLSHASQFPSERSTWRLCMSYIMKACVQCFNTGVRPCSQNCAICARVRYTQRDSKRSFSSAPLFSVSQRRQKVAFSITCFSV